MTFTEFVNESTKFNPRDVEGPNFEELISDYEADPENAEEQGIDVEAFKKQGVEISKLLGGNTKNVIFGDNENNDYEFYDFMSRVHYGEDTFSKNAKIPSVKVLKTLELKCAWRDEKTQVSIVEIPGVAKYATWMDGDDFTSFSYVAFKKSDLTKIAKWASENYVD